MEYNPLSKAKYTYWHSVIEIAADSGLSKEEWCRRNCVSIKTFNHFEGIFKRQNQRAALNSTDDIENNISGYGMSKNVIEPVVFSSTMGDKRTVLDTSADKTNDNIEIKVIPGTPFVEIPVMTDSDVNNGREIIPESLKGAEQNEDNTLGLHTGTMNQKDGGMQSKVHSSSLDNGDSGDKPAVVIKAGNLEMTFYGHVDEKSMIAAMRAVMYNA